MEDVINNSTILQDDDGCVFAENNSKYDMVIPAGTTVYPCPLCQKWFKSLEDYAKHNHDCGKIQYQWAQSQ